MTFCDTPAGIIFCAQVLLLPSRVLRSSSGPAGISSPCAVTPFVGRPTFRQVPGPSFSGPQSRPCALPLSPLSGCIRVTCVSSSELLCQARLHTASTSVRVIFLHSLGAYFNATPRGSYWMCFPCFTLTCILWTGSLSVPVFHASLSSLNSVGARHLVPIVRHCFMFCGTSSSPSIILRPSHSLNDC